MKPIHDYVLLTMEPAVEKINGIIVPQIAEEKPNTATVVAAGPECRYIKEGDNVLFLKHSGRPVEHEGKKCQYMKEAEIVAIL